MSYNIKSCFKPDTPQKNSEDALKFIEDNFTKQQNLVPIIVDFYINSDYSKPVIDLLCKVPDSLMTKIFDKLNEYLKINNPKLDKVMALLISMAYKAKSKQKWCPKLLQHQLFASLMRVLNAKSNSPNSVNNEYTTTQTCLLFAILLNTTPTLIANHSEMFQIVFNSYKSITTNEQQQQYKKHYDSNANNTVKWSMRLFMYIFYGLFPHLFLQYLRKKENQTINKDAINSLLNRLRMHPALLKDKPEYTTFTTQLSKPFDDTTFEWAQYCLDDGYTSMSKSALDSTTASTNRTLLQRQYSIASEASLPPLSPSYIYPVTKSTQESDKQRYPSSSQSARVNTRVLTPQMTIPLTQQIFNFPSNESIPLDYIEQQQQQQQHEILTNEQKKPIKNLTAQFMQSPEEKQQHEIKTKTQFPPLDENMRRKIEQKNLKQTNTSNINSRFSYFGGNNDVSSTTATSFNMDSKNILSRLHRSSSDSKLKGLNDQFYQSRPKAQTLIDGDQHESQPQPQQQQQQQKNDNLKFKQARSEMRDPNIIRDPSLILNTTLSFVSTTTTTPLSAAQTPSDFYSHSIASASESNMFGFNDLFSRQMSSRQPQYESNDILSSYLSRGGCSESALKREYEMLCYELIYERYLREKYECFLNKAFSMKIENEQLIQEKTDLEALYRKAIENQQEFENSKNKALHQQLTTCKQELQEKTKQFELTKHKEHELDMKLRDLQQLYDDQSVEYRKLQRKYELTEQSLENEKLTTKQYQNETVYIKSLRNMTDDLRKKLLIMTKMSNRLSNGNNSISNSKYFQINALYNEEIDELNNKIKDSQVDYNRLLSEYKIKDAKINELETELENKTKQIDDLNQQIYNSIAQINANLYKNNLRVYKSVLAINARLESEIIKLKSEKNELISQLEQSRRQQQQQETS